MYVHIILLDHDGEVWPEVLEYSTARIPYWGSYKWATGVRDGAQAYTAVMCNAAISRNLVRLYLIVAFHVVP